MSGERRDSLDNILRNFFNFRSDFDVLADIQTERDDQRFEDFSASGFPKKGQGLRRTSFRRQFDEQGDPLRLFFVDPGRICQSGSKNYTCVI